MGQNKILFSLISVQFRQQINILGHYDLKANMYGITTCLSPKMFAIAVRIGFKDLC